MLNRELNNFIVRPSRIFLPMLRAYINKSTFNKYRNALPIIIFLLSLKRFRKMEIRSSLIFLNICARYTVWQSISSNPKPTSMPGYRSKPIFRVFALTRNGAKVSYMHNTSCGQKHVRVFFR